MKKVTVKHLTKDEMTKCNSLLNSVANIHSCAYQAIEKSVFEFINAKEALIHSTKNYEQFKNNSALVEQVTNALNKAKERLANAQALIAI